MKYLLTALACVLLFSPSLKAGHITGGEFTVSHVEGNTFLGRLVLYRDCFSNQAEFDEVVPITVFDAITNEHLQELDFSFNGFEVTTPELGNSCFSPDVCVEIGVYETEFTLPDNPNGYYLSKERCCRNDLSINLQGIDLGFVFTVDVPDPALQNSSPQFGEYPSEAYLCINGPNVIAFNATDADGDSLVYSFVEPFNGESSFFNPDPIIASSKPYSGIPWAAGFSTDNQVGGTPPMAIDPETGIITAQPDQVGVFTIAVRVEEYRDGELIGTVRRELQLVSTSCLNDSPSVINTPDGDTVFDVLANTELCIPIEVFDPNTGDTLFVQGEGELLDGTITPQASFPDTDGFSNIQQDFCWLPVCENLQDSLYVVTITAFSQGCANEVLITEQNIYINVILEEDETTLLEAPMEGEVTIDLYDPSTHCFDFFFVDPNEADTLIIRPESDLFDLPNVSQIDPEAGQGSVTLPFCWDVVCGDVRDEPYFIDFEVIATNCEVQDTVIFTVPINVIVPEDEPAQFNLPDTIRWEFYSADTFCLDFAFTDPNFFDTLNVGISSEILSAPVNNASLVDFTAEANSLVDGSLCWSPICDQVREEPYIIEFTGQSESCKTNETVFHTTVLFLDLPADDPPVFELPMSGFSIDHSIGDDPIEFEVIVSDEDPFDTLSLSGQGDPLTDQVVNPASFDGFLTGNSSVLGEFSWIPDCPDVMEDSYLMTFDVVSSSCQKTVTTFIEIPISVTTPTMGEIEPIQNIFTPNGDGRNEVWTIEDKDDPCLENFNSVVYDRWGKEVFTTDRSDFEWDGSYPSGEEASEGTYFHSIEYFFKDRSRKLTGNVSITR